MKINIVIPYSQAELKCEIWANSEAVVNFKTDFFEAARCTVCFAATELKTWLQKVNISCVFSSKALEGFDSIVKLEIADEQSRSEEYSLSPTAEGICIHGKGRAGLLYGCYEFLKMQGFGWFAPGMTGTVVPKEFSKLYIPDKAIDFKPDMDDGRGFDFENYSIESAETFMWMARNRLNVAALSPKYYALQKKLCITIKAGGHIFEKMLDPNRTLSNGKTIFESHKDWYGVRDDGNKLTPQNCLSTQFCVSNQGLIDFLADELIKLFNNEWKYVDRADIWGFDTWGSVCCCNQCKTIGNATDITLHFIAELRKAINKTNLKDRVKLISCSYEGTSTMAPPSKPIPSELLEAGDCIVFYPINRCYEHDFSDQSCSTNRRYNEFLKGWSAIRQTMPIIIGEYYNVSKFEDLPLVFINRIKNDLPYYYQMGVRGITYMHFPLLNMGLRALNHLLYAELSWDTTADADKIVDKYFDLYYEKYAAKMKDIYLLVEDAFESCTQWRAWSGDSILYQLLDWDGLTPDKPIKADEHITTQQEIIAAGKASIAKLEEALKLADSILENDMYTKFNLVHNYSRNPVEQRQKSEQTKMYKRISDVRCFLIYGLDTFRLMTLLVEMYDAVMNGQDTAPLALELARLYKKMDSYYIPIASDALVVDTVCKTALDRTQLKLLSKKCISEYGNQ